MFHLAVLWMQMHKCIPSDGKSVIQWHKVPLQPLILLFNGVVAASEVWLALWGDAKCRRIIFVETLQEWTQPNVIEFWVWVMNDLTNSHHEIGMISISQFVPKENRMRYLLKTSGYVLCWSLTLYSSYDCPAEAFNNSLKHLCVCYFCESHTCLQRKISRRWYLFIHPTTLSEWGLRSWPKHLNKYEQSNKIHMLIHMNIKLCHLV